jgi:hypothetical protein
MKKIISALVIALLLASHQASAAPVWTAFTTVTSVEVINDGGFIVTLAAGVGSTCTAANAIYVQSGFNGVSADGAKALLATALSAFYLKQNIRFEYDDSTQYCFGTYATVTG